MIKNYLLIALRNFWRKKIFSLINIAGLAIGISASLVIYLIVHHEFSYEKFQKDGDRIYRVVTNMHFPEQDFKNAGVPGPLPDAVRSEIPGIEKSTVFWSGGPMKVDVPSKIENKNEFKKQEEIIYADDQYFQFFHYRWLAGSPDNSLDAPNKVVLTESRARTYFNYTDITNAIGQTIVYDDTVKATVTGIVKDLDEITDLTFKEFISLPTYTEQLKEMHGWREWGNVNSASQFFIQLTKGVDSSKINKQLAVVRKKNEKKAYLATDHFLQPLNDIHFNSDFDSFGHRQAHKPTLYGLLAVAAFLLILGCINFINLTTAQASQRAKEIGIRKTMGSSRKQLVVQFISETILLTTLSAIVSVLLTPSLLKIFSAYIPEGLHFGTFNQPDVFVFVILLILVVSILSGFYPALVLSGYKPVLVLKNLAYANTAQSRKVWIRKTLTVTQFVIAQFFIIATMVVGKQIRFSLNQDMGFKKDAIITFRAPYNYQHPDNKQFVLQQKLRSIPGIQKMSLAGPPPANEGYNISTMKMIGKNGKEIESSVEVKQADTNYFDLYKMKLLAGRRLQQSDTIKEYLINETYCSILGYKDPADIIGQTLAHGDSKIPIVGVFADIHTKSLHSPIQPVAFSSEAKEHYTFHVALPPKGKNTDNWKKTIAGIGSAWKEIYPDEQFNYEFFDESIAKFYKKEQDTANLLNWSTGLAIFISCLGLLGLVIFTTTQRIKEIGVRKVLGASVAQIVSLLSRDFISLVLLAFVIAAPLAWWAMNKWLRDFAYRTTFSWWIFAISGALMLIVALMTLSIQTVRSAVANPVKSLRTE
ncbi:MAG TPA: FtsX-like permease family protein [Chitinophagaceae bacterium]|jgi:putative ABC transport system permease protein|nr:FtsX-like permease family protein [Chitinophagaceae bacterium]